MAHDAIDGWSVANLIGHGTERVSQRVKAQPTSVDLGRIKQLAKLFCNWTVGVIVIAIGAAMTRDKNQLAIFRLPWCSPIINRFLQRLQGFRPQLGTPEYTSFGPRERDPAVSQIDVAKLQPSHVRVAVSAV